VVGGRLPLSLCL